LSLAKSERACGGSFTAFSVRLTGLWHAILAAGTAFPLILFLRTSIPASAHGDRSAQAPRGRAPKYCSAPSMRSGDAAGQLRPVLDFFVHLGQPDRSR